MFAFAQMSLWANVGLFAVAAALVWMAGSRLSQYADAISHVTGIGQAVIGLLLLAGVTSLPEIGVTVTSAAAGDSALAVNNLTGSIAMQVAILALIDFYIGRRALTSVLPDPNLILLGGLNILLLTIVASGAVVGDVGFAGLGAWSSACIVGYAASIWILAQSRGRKPWLPARSGRVAEPPSEEGGDEDGEAGSLKSLLLKTGVAAAIILVAGYVLSRTASAIAEQTGLGQSFVGFVLLATSTSLPELSSALSAARLGRLTMAISDILGTNMINVGLIFVVDLVATGELVFNTVDSFATFGALLSIAVTTLFIIGLAERRDRTAWRLGYDSIAVLVLYLGGLVLLYTLRPQ